MFPKSSLRRFWLLVLVLSTLWAAAVFAPFLYSVLSPATDIRAIVHALQGRGFPPPQATATVHEVLDVGGLLGRVIHVAHYTGGAVKFEDHASHTMTRTEDSYIAWFQKSPRPILLVVRRIELDGNPPDYEVGSLEDASFLARAYAPPFVSLVVSLYAVRKKPI